MFPGLIDSKECFTLKQLKDRHWGQVSSPSQDTHTVHTRSHPEKVLSFRSTLMVDSGRWKHGGKCELGSEMTETREEQPCTVDLS